MYAKRRRRKKSTEKVNINKYFDDAYRKVNKNFYFLRTVHVVGSFSFSLVSFGRKTNSSVGLPVSLDKYITFTEILKAFEMAGLKRRVEFKKI